MTGFSLLLLGIPVVSGLIGQRRWLPVLTLRAALVSSLCIELFSRQLLQLFILLKLLKELRIKKTLQA